MPLRVSEFQREHLQRIERFEHENGWSLSRLVDEHEGKNCYDIPLDEFFPSMEESPNKPLHKTLRAEMAANCRGCPVADECLAGAVLRGEQYGGWGGVSQPDFQELSRLWRYRNRHGTYPIDRRRNVIGEDAFVTRTSEEAA